jgi:acyl-CoA synthetase (AMP-forming)/AMP-acid ligase II
VATLDADGFVQITDRSKDVIKSGWRMDLVDRAREHRHGPPRGAGGRRDRRGPQPLAGAPAAADRAQGRHAPTSTELLAFMDGKVAKWCLPDDVVLVDALPHTATGKLQKLKLREQFRNHRLPSDPA